MDYRTLLAQISQKKYSPIYFLHGDEPYYIDKICNTIEASVLTEEEKYFNQSILYGKDIDGAALEAIARKYPMCAPYQVVIVREAQDLDKPEMMEAYLKNPSPTTILVLAFKYKTQEKKRKKILSLVMKSGVVFESKTVYDRDIPSWITNYVKDDGFTITHKSTFLINEFLGNKLSKIANELDKMMINIPQKREIVEQDVEHFIGISKDYNIYELQDAIGQKNVINVNKILTYFCGNSKEFPSVKVISSLFFFFKKLFIYQFLEDKSSDVVAAKLAVPKGLVYKYSAAAKQYPAKKLSMVVALLNEYDLKSKGVNVPTNFSDQELLKELVFRILYV